MGLSDWWCSPPEIADPLAQFFAGPVDVDPCSNLRSIIQAVLKMTHGGLVRPWMLPPETFGAQRSAYENPPYSQGEVWANKAIAEVNCGNVNELVRLTMTATSSEWWAAVCMQMNRNPRILCLRRLTFIDPETGKIGDYPCRFDPALTYVGPRTELFTKTFSHLTRWSTWGR